MHRSLGTAGQPGDAASSRRSPCRDRGLLDDHPAAAVALHRAPVQRTAPCLVEVLRLDGASAHQPFRDIYCTGRAEAVGMFTVPANSYKTCVDSTGLASGIVNPMEEFMHHIMFAKLDYLCVCMHV